MMTPVRLVHWCSTVLRNGALGLFMALWIPALSLTASAQKPHIISFDAPGADTKPGDFKGTYPSGINIWGTITGSYQSADTVFHGFLRTREGRFTTFAAPGAGTDGFQGTGCPSDCPTSINDLGDVMGTYIDANYVLHGYLRTPKGKFATVDPVGSVFTWSSDINDVGNIAGYYLDADNVYHGFLRIPD